jgi:ABC-type transport system involved in cytochrome c biogenesis permease subunit
MKPILRCLTVLLSLLALPLPLAGAAQHEHALPERTEPWTAKTLEMAARLPIQDQGRIKPFSTYAGFTLLRLNGKRAVETPPRDELDPKSTEKLDPTAWALDVLFFPEQSGTYEFFLVSNDEVIAAMGLSLPDKRKRDRYSFEELKPGLDKLFELARDYHRIEEKNRTTVQQQVVILANNVQTYLDLSAQALFAIVTIPLEPGVQAAFDGATEAGLDQILAKMPELVALQKDADSARSMAAMHTIANAAQLARYSTGLALIPPVVSVADDIEWISPGELLEPALHGGGVPEDQRLAVASLREMGTARTKPAEFESALQGLLNRTQALAERRSEYSKVQLEVTYYNANLIRNSLVLFVLAFVLTAVLWLRPRNRILYGITAGTVFVATLLLVGAIVMRCVIRGRPPVSTLYETIIFVGAVGCLTALAIEWINKKRIALSLAAFVGMIFLFLANGYETLDKQDTMPSLVAVLDTNYWLAIHVTAITAGYSAGMLAALMASAYLIAKLVGIRRGDRAFYSGLGRMVYGILCFAVIFSTLGTILGGVWANDSWGRFWGWDPKENGALLIVISQLAILHGRMGGYLREHGVCMAAAFGGTVIAFSWFGVNLLGVGLHSYGFTSGIHTALWTYYISQWGIVGLGGVAWLLERQRVLAAPPKAAARKASDPLAEGTQLA